MPVIWVGRISALESLVISSFCKPMMKHSNITVSGTNSPVICASAVPRKPKHSSMVLPATTAGRTRCADRGMSNREQTTVFRCCLITQAKPWSPIVLCRVSETSQVAQWRCTEQAAVFAAELRRAFIADPVTCRGGFQAFAEHQAPRFLQAQLLLILQGAEGGDCLEAVVQGRGAEVDLTGQVLDTQGLVEMLVQPFDGAGDALALAVGDGDLVQAVGLGAVQETVENLAQGQRREHGDIARCLQ